MTTIKVAAADEKRTPLRMHDHILLPLIQVTGASFALASWWANAWLIAVPQQAPAIRAYALSTILALPLGFGISNLLPNLFRNASSPRGRGAWSPYVTIVSLIGIAAILSGALWFIARVQNSGSVAGPLALAIAGFIATSSLCAQLARIQQRPALMVASVFGQAILPIGWLVGSLIRPSANFASIVVIGIEIVWLSLLLFAIRDTFGPFGPSLLEARFVRDALVLVPHLSMFGLLMQGLRIASRNGTSSDLVAAHELMLVFTVALTLAGSMHSVLSVQLQTADEIDYPSIAHKNLVIYTVIGTTLGTLVAAALALRQWNAAEDSNLLSLTGVLAGSTILPLVMSYYAMSAVALRERRSWIVTASSGTAVITFLLLNLVSQDPSTNDQMILYAVSIAMLPVSCGLLLTAATGRTTEQWSRVRFCTLGIVFVMGAGALVSVTAHRLGQVSMW